MPWFSKEQPTPYDAEPISGLEFLHGDVLARQYGQTWVEGKKYPLVSFPSGVKREIRLTDGHDTGVVHIFGDQEISYRSHRDEAYAEALKQAAEHGYDVRSAGTNKLKITNPYSTRSYELTFDEEAGRLANIILS